MIRLAFTRLAGKYDRLVVTRADGSSDSVDCPKQGMIPHDMVHYAVESVLAARGFLSNVADGAAVAFTDGASDEAEPVERLVETMQADAGEYVSAPDINTAQKISQRRIQKKIEAVRPVARQQTV